MKTTMNLFFSFFIFYCITSYSQIMQIDKLEPDDSGRWFGSTVVMEGDIVVVGCPYDITNGQSSGSVYIYDLVEKSLIKIVGADVDKDDTFGSSIAIDNQTIAVGAPRSGAYWEGAVYMFKKNLSGEWTQEAKLTKSSAGEQFGRRVSLDGDQLMIATDHDSAYIYVRMADSTWRKEAVISDVLYPRLVCINGNYAAICDPAGYNEEAVYIYHKTESVWNLMQELYAIEGQGKVAFGQSVVMQNDYLVIGAPMHGKLNSSGTIVGAVYIYKLNNAVFERDTILFKSNIHLQSRFGASVNILEDILLIGAPNFNQGGGLFLYQKIGDNWIEFSDTIRADDVGYNDSFGSSIATSDDYIIVGAPQHNPIDFLSAYGAVYIFENGYLTEVEEKKKEGLPKEFLLSQNYPNPFNPSTTIKYQIPSSVISNPSKASGERSPYTNSEISLSGRNDNINVTLRVYDILGREVATLINEQQAPGYYEVEWNAPDTPSGVYFYQLKTGSYNEIRKMVLLR